MKLLGLEITRQQKQQSLSPVYGGGGWGNWWPFVQDWATGAWQTNTEITINDSLSYWAVFRCISIISSDIAKLEIRLMGEDASGIPQEVESPAFSPVLRKPNHYQNRIQFFETWLQSKLSRGNTYILKERDNRGVVIGLYILDPCRVRPMVASNGEIFYELQQDYLSDLPQGGIMAPASEIIHDRWNTFYHPLVGLSPLYASAISSMMGQKIQKNGVLFFGNGSIPGGILTAPGEIKDETALRLKQHWEANYSGSNVGKVAVLGDGLKFEQMRMTATDAQLIEQLKWTDTTIAGAWGVPAYMINAGTTPAYNNVEALNQQYYSQCLQIHIESIELCLDEGLGLEQAGYEAEFELDDLLRMDTATQINSIKDAVSAGVMKPNEGREKLGFGPVEGGDSPYLQQQNYSLAALNKRDTQVDPFAPNNPQPNPNANPSPNPDAQAAQAARAFMAMRKEFANA